MILCLILIDSYYFDILSLFKHKPTIKNAMSSVSTSTVTRQINQTQDKVNDYLYRVAHLEKLLRNLEMPMEQRMELEDELAEIKKQILKSENDLKIYYRQNRKTFIFVVFFVFFSFLIYGLYVMIVGPP